jgi:hypothetical protein
VIRPCWRDRKPIKVIFGRDEIGKAEIQNSQNDKEEDDECTIFKN